MTMHTTIRRISFGLALFTLIGAGLPAEAANQGPLKGNGEGSVTSFVPGSEGITMTTVAQGNATHLGLYTREEVILLNPGTGTFQGQIVYTAANGDQLFGTVAGGFTSPTTATGIYIFSSGTGRFANASGSASFVLATPDGLNFKVRFEGSLF
jgi:hypothetical protein